MWKTIRKRKGHNFSPGNRTTGSLTRELAQTEEEDRSAASKEQPRVVTTLWIQSVVGYAKPQQWTLFHPVQSKQYPTILIKTTVEGLGWALRLRKRVWFIIAILPSIFYFQGSPAYRSKRNWTWQIVALPRRLQILPASKFATRIVHGEFCECFWECAVKG